MALLGEVTPDGRRRISFARLIPDLEPGDRFEVSVEEDGTIVLTPVVSVLASVVEG